jgi:DNA-binding NtrC family response regulator
MVILQNYDWPGNVRELRNQVERMLVLSYGSRLRPKDIPAYIYERANPARFLPVAPARERAGEEHEAEFLYRYLFELRRDVAEIKRLLEEAYRAPLVGEISVPPAEEAPLEEAEGGVATIDVPAAEEAPRREGASPGDLGFRVGMGLDELERRAIELTLNAVKGNRRKAASVLGIGERTLYRKLKEYGLA